MADETKFLMLELLETRVEYFPVPSLESDPPPNDIMNFAWGFFNFSAAKLAKPLRDISAQESEGFMTKEVGLRMAKAYK